MALDHTWLHRFADRVDKWWGDTRDFAHGLWIARVSLASVVISGLLFYLARPAQDLFLEVRDTPLLTLWYWGIFYFVVLLCWVFPVYLSARWILSRAAEIAKRRPEVDPAEDWVRRLVPPFLAALCLGAVLVGQVMAVANAPIVRGSTASEVARLEIKNELKAACPDINVASYRTSLWVDIPHLTNCRPFNLAVALPRAFAFMFAESLGADSVILTLYGIAAFLCVWLLLRRPIRKLPTQAWRTAEMTGWWAVTILVVVPFVLITLLFVFGFIEGELARPYGLWHLALLPPVTLLLGFLVWRGLGKQPGESTTRVAFSSMRWLLRKRGSVDGPNVTTQLVNPLFVGVALVALGAWLILFIYVNPVDAARNVVVLRRAILIPLFLGLAVPPLTYLSAWSLQTRAPLILGGLAILFVAGEMLLDPHEMRFVQSQVEPASFERSLERWADVNQCDFEAPATCPSPILISAAGGASRAALHLAGLIGMLMDDKPLAVSISGDGGPIKTLAISTDGRRILSSFWDEKAAMLWDAESGREIAVLYPRHNDDGIDAIFGPDGRRIAIISADDTAQLWDAENGKKITDLAHEGDLTIDIPTFSPDGRRIVIISADNTAQLWDAEKGIKIRDLAHENDLINYGFSPDSRHIVTASKDNTARLWDAEDERKIAILRHMDDLKDAIFSTDGHRIVTLADKTVRVWDVDTRSEIVVLPHEEDIEFFDVIPNGRRIVTVLRDNTARLWDVESGSEMAVLNLRHKDDLTIASFRRIVYSPDGRRIVIISADNTAQLWDAEKGIKIRDLAHKLDIIFFPIFSPDSRRIMINSAENSVELWDAEDGRWIEVLKHNDLVRNAIFSPDSRRVVTVSDDNTARLWDAEDGRRIEVLKHNDLVSNAIFSPDSRRVVTASDDNTAKLWDAENGKKIAVLRHKDDVQLFGFTRHRIVTSGEFNTARLWDGATGAPIFFGVQRKRRSFGKQLFAVSGVSGGALGAVVFYAALADAQRSGNETELTTAGTGQELKPPCKANLSDDDWFRSRDLEHPPQPHESWKDCLQLITSGDFLSPIFISMMSGDILEFQRHDRAVVLEEAWEARYAEVTSRDAGHSEELFSKQSPLPLDAKENRHARCRDFVNPPGVSTLAQPMRCVRNKVLKPNPLNWLPILLLNGTSVQTGRRIIASDIEIRGMFRDAYDLTQMLNGPEPTDPDSSMRLTSDIRLSTAATVSARFPIVTPHGNIVRQSDKEIVDRVVDGGYYENFGAATTLELAEALKKRHFKPFVILVNNEPTTPNLDCGHGEAEASVPLKPDELAFTTLLSPLRALFRTRSARGTHAAAQLCNYVGADMFAFITLRQQSGFTKKEPSVSWWLSKNVQRYLDGELTEGPNYRALQKIIDIRR